MASASVVVERVGEIGLIRATRPPVNAIDFSMRKGLDEGLASLIADPGVRLILLTTAGPHFMAGVDITEFDAQAKGPALQQMQSRIESSPKAVVAAIQGLALGGGLELALACHNRIAHQDAKLGLPEITLGLIPGAGGTQRLPRLVGARVAFDMMLSGTPLSATEAQKCGLVDAVCDGDLVAFAMSFCRTLLQKKHTVTPTRARPLPDRDFDQSTLESILKQHARTLKGRCTQLLLAAAVKAAVEKPFEQGIEVEQELAKQSLAAVESRALRYMFFAERNAGKVTSSSAGSPNELNKAAVIGAGTMGSGIATALADAGLEVALIDSTSEGLNRGQAIVSENYRSAVKRGRIDQNIADARMGRIIGSLSLHDAADADFVVEAVYEELSLKQDVLQRLDKILPPHVPVATNTSTLSVTQLGRATAHPERVAGLHFFSPAHVMKLVEVIRGADSSDQTISSALQIAAVLKKTPVICRDAFGFIGNRMMLDGYFREAEQLLLEGASPAQVDSAMEMFGFAMGPQRVSDLGGTDVGTKARRELFRSASRPDPYFVIADRLTELGRLGQKSGAGFYRYPAGSRDPVPDDEVVCLIQDLARERGIVQRKDITADEIVERCVLALVNVGAQVLEEGVARRSADIDVVWTSGYGFPRHRGGPMFYADTLGLSHVLPRLRMYHDKLGQYWKPAALIADLATKQGSFQQWDAAQ